MFIFWTHLTVIVVIERSEDTQSLEYQNMQNVRTMKKLISELKPGETFYLNAISATVGMVELTKELIKNGTITPDPEELSRVIKEECHPRFLNGNSIAPQMVYIKLK